MEQLISHAPLAGYFALIGYLLLVIKPLSIASNPKVKLFQFLAVLFLLITWTYMVLYFKLSFNDAFIRAGSPRIFTSHDWLVTTSLFNEAWSRVCFEIERWWWSQQLCLWTTGAFTVFLYQNGNRIKHPWAYMFLGQVVAISFAQSLFLAKLSSLNRRVDSSQTINDKDSKVKSIPPAPTSSNENPSLLLCICVYLSLITVVITPLSIRTDYFLPNLLIMHALLIIPLLPTFTPSSSNSPISYSTLYLSIAFLSLLTLIPTYSKLFPSILSISPLKTLQQLKSQAIYTLFEHPAQSSIGFDVVFTSISFLVWILLEFRKSPMSTRNFFLAGLVVVITPVVGIAVSGSLYLGLREGEQEKVKKVD